MYASLRAVAAHSDVAQNPDIVQALFKFLENVWSLARRLSHANGAPGGSEFYLVILRAASGSI